MVDDFSTADNKYNFTIDSKPYFLPALTFGDVEQLGDEEDDAKRGEMMHDIVFARANKRTADAIRTLTPEQVGRLLRRYAGMTPGESSASAE